MYIWKKKIICMPHAFKLGMTTFDLADGALDTWSMYSHHLANQMQPQVSIIYRQINSIHMQIISYQWTY